jgi:ADP-ribosylglycohydrolase
VLLINCYIIIVISGFAIKLKEFSMENLKDKMIYSAFIGDALAMGVHWIYTSETVIDKFDEIVDYIDPKKNQYHNNKQKGEQTHYGDQMMLLLESLADNKGFDINSFSLKWQNYFKDYAGYFDGATKTTLANLKNGSLFLNAGSESNDLSGAARIAPLVYFYHNNVELLVKYSREQTLLTHRDRDVADAAEFFARAAVLVLNGEHPVDAVKKTAKDSFKKTMLDQWVTKGLENKTEDTVKTLNEFGLSCHIHHAFPGVIQVIARHENDLKGGLSECIKAGGDNAARSIIAGMILGASKDSGELPVEWISGLGARDKIKKLLEIIKK